MIKIKEKSFLTSNKYEKWIVSKDGDKKFLDKTVNIKPVTIKKDNYSYMYLYSSNREVIEETFEFMNSHIKDYAYNSRVKMLNVLVILYSFVELFNVNLKEISLNEALKFKDFLYGNSREGINYSLDLKTKRSPNTINSYFGVCRKYLEFLENEETPFHTKKITSKRKDTSGFYAHTREINLEKYKISEKTVKTKKVPMYIKVDEFKTIIKIIRENYNLREEIIVRLMYENGLRLGEVLGLTLEDIEVLDSRPKIIIRNRLTDRRDQLAKTCYNPLNQSDYESKQYKIKEVGYQEVIITKELLNKIDKYIEKVHGIMSKRKRDNYLKESKADKITSGELLESGDNYYTFLNKNGTPLRRGGWNKRLKKIFVEAGIYIDKGVKKYNLNHRFRHGFAMFLKKHQAADELDLMKALRHSDTSTVEIYFRPDSDDMYKAMCEAADSMYELIPELKS